MRNVLALVLIATPAFAEKAPKSEAGTAFMETCLADVVDHRVATLKKQAPDYAATLSSKQLFAGASHKAEQACPCFLHVIAVSEDVPGDTPEERVAHIVTYLDMEKKPAMPPVIARLTRMCGQRGSILPPSWIGG